MPQTEMLNELNQRFCVDVAPLENSDMSSIAQLMLTQTLLGPPPYCSCHCNIGPRWPPDPLQRPRKRWRKIKKEFIHSKIFL